MNLRRLFTRSPKVQVFLRTCYYSDVSAHKKRPSGFSHQRCVENLIETLDEKEAFLTVLLDTARKENELHFVFKQTKTPIIEISEGTETGSFLQLLKHVEDQKFDPETVLYFVEDDYLHRPGWVSVLKEAFSLEEASYVTLYDHKDKYLLPQYENLSSRLFYTKTTHWRTTPSTTNTYAMKWKTLKKDMAIHRSFSEGRMITADHDKFCKLSEEGGRLLSAIPGWSAHMDPECLSPCLDWGKNSQKSNIFLPFKYRRYLWH